MKIKLTFFLTFILTSALIFTGCLGSLTFKSQNPFEREILDGGQVSVKAQLFGQNFESIWPSDPDEPSVEFYKSLNDFSYKIFQTIDPQGKNNMVSPLSVFIALAMTLNGADGTTKTEMIEALQAEGLSLDDINKYTRDFIILSKSDNGSTVFDIANSIWFREGFVPDKEFLQKNVDFFMSNAQALDFNSKAAIDTINAWVKEATNGTIEEIIEEISPLSVMFLINAIYFNAKWEVPFLGEDTFEGNFKGLAQTFKTDFMNRIGDMDYLDFDNAKGVILPYDDSRFVFVALMPVEGASLQEAGNYFSHGGISDIFAKSSAKKVNLSIPKFEHEYEISMNDTLQALGMKEAFLEMQADLSLINENREKNLFISEVKHKTYIRFFEKGTEAAAVTSVEIRLTSGPVSDVVLNFNRPFVYAIIDKTNNVPVFLGNYFEP